MMHRFLALFTMFFLCLGGLRSQDVAPLSPAEHTILSLISRDSMSSTVVYFSRDMQFGIADQGNRYLVLVKKGKDNFFLLEGTNRVYLVENGNNGPILVRQDKTTHEGDNLLMMGFLRKDTLFQYGGYGFWKVRDFFTYYVPGTREWEFFSGGQPLESMISWHYYDPVADRFYLIGRQTKNPHVGENLFIYDSVYAYDFSIQRFSALGTITAIDWRNEFKSHLGTTMTAPYGLLMAWARQLKLVDCGQNRIYEITGPKRDTVDQAFRAFDSLGPQNTIMYLRDTVYWISGNGQKASVQKLKLTKDDFDTRSGMPLFKPGAGWTNQSLQASTSTGLSYPWVLLLVMGASTAAYVAGRRMIGRRRDNPSVQATERYPSTGNLRADLDAPASQARDDGGIGFFLQHLTPVETDLLREMVRYSLQDRKMETDAINKILGVYNKDPEIQKARRSNAITHINNTFTQTTRRSGLLIQRERDEVDKRVYVYFIPQDLAAFVSGGWNDHRQS